MSVSDMVRGGEVGQAAQHLLALAKDDRIDVLAAVVPNELCFHARGEPRCDRVGGGRDP